MIRKELIRLFASIRVVAVAIMGDMIGENCNGKDCVGSAMFGASMREDCRLSKR
jgi:hypothetical protein